MADNKALPATGVGSSITCATDEIAGVDYQKVKLVDGTADSTTVIIADGAGGLATGGSLAHDAVESGNPVAVGGIARTANPTAVAALDRVRAWFTVLGKLVVVPHAPRDLTVTQHTQIASSSSETTILTAGAAGVFHDVLMLMVTNQTATAYTVTIKDATSGTTRYVWQMAATVGDVKGVSLSIPHPQATAANNWTATLSSAAVTANIQVVAIKSL